MSNSDFGYHYTLMNRYGNKKIEKFLHSVKDMQNNNIPIAEIKQKVLSAWAIFVYDYPDIKDTDARDCFWENLEKINPEFFTWYNEWECNGYTDEDVEKHIRKRTKIKPKTKKLLQEFAKWFDNTYEAIEHKIMDKEQLLSDATYKELVQRGMTNIPEIIEKISINPSYLCLAIEEIVGDVIKSHTMEDMCKDCIHWYKGATS